MAEEGGPLHRWNTTGLYEKRLTLIRSIGEESYVSGTSPPLTDEPTFCVDPIGERAGNLC
jgi:hypothetical protein